jgi:hypothetical protein
VLSGKGLLMGWWSEQLADSFGRDTKSHGNFFSRRLAAHPHAASSGRCVRSCSRPRWSRPINLPSSFPDFCREYDPTRVRSRFGAHRRPDHSQDGCGSIIGMGCMRQRRPGAPCSCRCFSQRSHSPAASVGALRSGMTVAELWCAVRHFGTAFTASCKGVPLVRYVRLDAGSVSVEGRGRSMRKETW